MMIVGIMEAPAEALRQRAPDGGLSRTGNAHDDHKRSRIIVSLPKQGVRL
jgi:hypothetical protein